MLNSMTKIQIRIHDMLQRNFSANGLLLRQEHAVYIFVQLRQFVEANHLQKKYKRITFYADWVVHPELDRSFMRREIHPLLVAAFADVDGDDNRAEVSAKVNKAIGLSALRKELIEIFKELGLPSDLFLSKESWAGFIKILAPEVVGKRVDFSNAKQLGEVETTKGKKVLARTIQILSMEAQDGEPIMWKIVGFDSLRQVPFEASGVLGMYEDPSAFLASKYEIKST